MQARVELQQAGLCEEKVWCCTVPVSCMTKCSEMWLSCIGMNLSELLSTYVSAVLQP